MQNELNLMLLTSVSIAILHTVTGPDHYLPFVALSKSGNWSFPRTLFWTLTCGCGHVWSSVLLGLGGAAMGWSLSEVRGLESVRGGIAGWALIAFGIVYGVWGLVRAHQSRPHKHFDLSDGKVYVFEHSHQDGVVAQRYPVTPWVMFIIFVLGPCEPMIPLLYFPASQKSWWGMSLVVGVYTFFTLLSMVTLVTLGYHGVSFFKSEKLHRYAHAIGGLTILGCGGGLVFMGW